MNTDFPGAVEHCQPCPQRGCSLTDGKPCAYALCPNRPGATAYGTGSGTVAAAVARLMGHLHHQLFMPDVTTMGACPSCGHASRGASRCARCLFVELQDLLTSSVESTASD